MDLCPLAQIQRTQHLHAAGLVEISSLPCIAELTKGMSVFCKVRHTFTETSKTTDTVTLYVINRDEHCYIGHKESLDHKRALAQSRAPRRTLEAPSVRSTLYRASRGHWACSECRHLPRPTIRAPASAICSELKNVTFLKRCSSDSVQDFFISPSLSALLFWENHDQFHTLRIVTLVPFKQLFEPCTL